jgi:glycosyltransferase involved in cell wall biosynthesis
MITGQFNESYPPIMDGVGMVTRQYATWLNRKYGTGIAVTVQMPGEVEDDPDGPEVMRVGSVAVPGMPPYRAPVPFFSPKVKKRLKSIPFDIVHSHAPFVLGRMARSIAQERGIPIVTTFHSKYRDDFEKALPTRGMREIAMRYILKFYHSVDMVWVPNRATVETVREYGYTGPVDVMYNGTDLDLPSDIDTYRHAGAELAQVSDNRPVLLYIGQHRWEKNLKLMLEALALVKEQVPQFRMVFVGQGYAEKELEAMTKRLGLQDQVRFLGVIRDREQIKQLYARSTLFLFPSEYDTSPLTLREAAAFHVPTLLVGGASATEGIRHGTNGLIAENSPRGYADAALAVINDGRMLERVGQGAYDTLFRTWEQVADEVHLRYKELLEKKRG